MARNFIDRCFEAVAPVHAVRRSAARTALQFLNSGYGNYGANLTKKSMRGWEYHGGSSKEDIEDNIDVLRQRSRDAYMGVPVAASALKTLRTNVVAGGLMPAPQIDGAFLGLSAEQTEELQEKISAGTLDFSSREISMATARLAYPFICDMAARMMEMVPGLMIHVYEIRNDFFGEMITVSGLLTGQDLIAQLTGKELGEALYLPQNVLRSGEEVFLDDVTVTEMEKALQVKVDIIKSSGRDFVNAVLDRA